MFCQACGALNQSDREYCARCNQKLLVVSGGAEQQSEVLETDADDGFSFDEHLLERISSLEEAVKRTAHTLRQLLGAMGKQERNILINQTGLATLRELLQQKRVLSGEEWRDLWESKMDYQLGALEKRERFVAIKDRIAALHRGDKHEAFVKLLEDAEYALFAFDVDRALEALQAAHKMDRHNYELAYFIGETYFNEGQTEFALKYFARVLETKPDHYEGLVYSGVTHHEHGEPQRAEEHLKRAVSIYPESFLPLFSLGAVYASQGQPRRAIAYLQRAVEVEPLSQALFVLASSLYDMGRTTAAIRYLEQAVRQDPAFEEALHLLGLAYLDRHWNKKALRTFKQAQRLNPRKLRYQDLVQFLSGPASSPLPEVSGEAARLLARAEKSLAEDKPERALGSYRRALSVEPDNPTLLMSYAAACLQLNRCNETETAARRVLDMNPNEMLKATASATLIEALRTDGRLREGNRIGARLCDEGTTDFTKTIAYYEMAFNLAEMEEDLDQALDYARQSLELSPEEIKQFPLAALGWVHYKREEYDEAVEFLSRASEMEPSETSLTHLGMALLASGDKEQARGVLAQAQAFRHKGSSLEQKMMECMRDSGRLLQRVQQGRKK